MILDDQFTDIILESVINYYGEVGLPYLGRSFILPDGKFLDIKNLSGHFEVEIYLSQQGLSLYEDFNSKTGSPTLRDAGCIRVSTSSYYIQLPRKELTAQQYDSLYDWIALLSTTDVPFLEIIYPADHPSVIRRDIIPDIIIEEINNYYIGD